jgi:hypothetical protein
MRAHAQVTLLCGQHGWTALMNAAYWGRTATIVELLRLRADVSATNHVRAVNLVSFHCDATQAGNACTRAGGWDRALNRARGRAGTRRRAAQRRRGGHQCCVSASRRDAQFVCMCSTGRPRAPRSHRQRRSGAGSLLRTCVRSGCDPSVGRSGCQWWGCLSWWPIWPPHRRLSSRTKRTLRAHESGHTWCSLARGGTVQSEPSKIGAAVCSLSRFGRITSLARLQVRQVH